MNFERDIQTLIDREGEQALRIHANASTRSGHRCRECFCCAAADWIEISRTLRVTPAGNDAWTIEERATPTLWHGGPAVFGTFSTPEKAHDRRACLTWDRWRDRWPNHSAAE